MCSDATMEARTEPRPATRAAEILVVEDDPLLAFELQNQLAAMGHHAIVAESGRVAVGHAHDVAFDLVLMELASSTIDGFTTASEIRAFLDVPIIYMTAAATAQTFDRVRATEPFGYLLKPFHRRELEASIAMALEHYGADHERRDASAVQAFLAEASARFATTNDDATLLFEAARLLVPQVADWCLVGLDDPSGARPAIACARPSTEGVRSWQRGAGLVDAVMRHGRALELGHGTSAEELGVDVVVPASGRGFLSCTPIVARGRTLGVLVVWARRHVVGLDDFAQRLGLALDNALLHGIARRAIQQRDDVLAMVSHDLRNPLGAIILRARSLAKHAESVHGATAILSAAHSMNRLITDLLDASAMDAGKLALAIAPSAVRELVEETRELLQPDADVHGVAVTSALLADDVVRCDRGRIQQVLVNLVGNALRYTPEGGTITIRTERHDRELWFAVADTGTGISTVDLPHVFERYWRGADGHIGAGLGLHVCKEIIAAHLGRLWVESAPRAGTTFSFSLPIAGDVPSA